MKDTCLILDGFSLTYRAYFGMPDTIRTRSGLAINAVLGFYNTLTSLINQIHPRYLVVAFDLPHPTFRHTMYQPYKAQRPPMPLDLRAQIPLIREVLAACNIPILALQGYEADDILGTITRLLPPETEAYVVTTDRDALQLVTNNVSVLVPNSRENKIFTPHIVKHEWQVPPKLIPDLKALMGDASDNIPGVPKVGPKTAVKWLTAYGSLENTLAAADTIKGKVGESLREHKEQTILYKDLATIRVDAPIVWCWKSLALTQDFSPLRETLERIGIRASLPRTS